MTISHAEFKTLGSALQALFRNNCFQITNNRSEDYQDQNLDIYEKVWI